MNEYAIIFWLAFIIIFLSHFCFLRLEKEKLNIFQFIMLLGLNYTFYMLTDFCAVNYGPQLIGTYGSQTMIGTAAGWFIARNLKNTFRLSKFSFLIALSLLTVWYNYIF